MSFKKIIVIILNVWEYRKNVSSIAYNSVFVKGGLLTI